MKSKQKKGTSSNSVSLVSIDGDSLRQRIEKKAYMIFLKRDGTHGYDLNDWLEGERIVKKELAGGMGDLPPTDKATNLPAISFPHPLKLNSVS